MTSSPEHSIDNIHHLRIELSGCQDVRKACTLHRTVIELLESSRPSYIDCENVDSLDAAAVQILWAAKREAREKLQIVATKKSEADKWFSLSGLENRLKPIHAIG